MRRNCTLVMWHMQMTRAGLREASLTQHRLTVRTATVSETQPPPDHAVSQTPRQQLLDSDCDMVGPPDTVSNIRPLRLRQPVNESEREIQKLRLRIWEIKHHFWTQHNTQFKQEKAAFSQCVLKRKQASGELSVDDDVSKVTADELSTFYKDFLDKKYKDQKSFTRDWMKLNLLLTWKQFKHSLQTLLWYSR